MLDRLGLSLKDIGLIELHEAFAAQVLSVTQEWGFNDNDFDRLSTGRSNSRTSNWTPSGP